MRPLEEVFIEVSRRLGDLRKYQKYILKRIFQEISAGTKFIIVAMPTGSGKTWIEIALATSFLEDGRILVLEPTRFLCDQMYLKVWKKALNCVGKEYEGNCRDLLDEERKVVISTPQTAFKALKLGASFDFVIVDEAHHMLGSKPYHDLFSLLSPNLCIGFTALLPKKKLKFSNSFPLGTPKLISYDFKALSKIDPGFDPPKAVLDIYETELTPEEEKIWNKIVRGEIPGERKILKLLKRTLEIYGIQAFLETYRREMEKGKIFGEELKIKGKSHKTIALKEILSEYLTFLGGAPVISIVFRRALAKEFFEVMKEFFGCSFIISGESSKEERLRILNEISEKGSFAISSTSVGEEGIDLPEAKILILGDVTESPLRFYQRLGRLIRISSLEKTKYLVLVINRRSGEREKLSRAIEKLVAEGVDIGYVLEKVKEPSFEPILEEFKKERERIGSPLIPLSSFAITAKKDPLEELEKALRENLKEIGPLQDPFLIFTVPILRYEEKVKKAIKKAKREIARAPAISLILQEVRRGKLMYLYDPDSLETLFFREIERLKRICESGKRKWIENRFFRIDIKTLTLPLWEIFLPSDFQTVKERLEEELKEVDKELQEIKIGKGYVYPGDYTERTRTLRFMLSINVHNEVDISLRAQINFYEIPKSLLHKYLDLIPIDLELSSKRAILRFFFASE